MASVPQQVWQQPDCCGAIRESGAPLHHVQRPASLSRVSSCSSTASCVTAQWGEVFEQQQQQPSSTATRPRNIPTACGARKRPTPEPLCDVAVKRVKEEQGGSLGSSCSGLDALDAPALLLRNEASVSSSLAGPSGVLGSAQAVLEAGYAPVIGLPAPVGSGELSFCHFDLPGLLDDFLGCASGLDFVAPAAAPASSFQQAQAPHSQPQEPVGAAGSVDPVFRNISGLRDVLRNLRKTERGLPAVVDYMAGLACLPRGEYVDRHMRRIAVSWLVEVAGEFGLHTETLFLAVALLDRYLSTQAVERRFLQLVSTTCMFLAAKHEEEAVPSVNDFTNIADNCFTKQDLLRMESVVLDALEFRLNVPTPHDFLQLYMQGAAVGPRTRALASYILELTLLDYAFVGQRGSVVAAAALHYAALHQGEVAAAHALSDLSEVPATLLQPALADLSSLHAHACTIPLHDDVDPVGPIKDRHQGVAPLPAMPLVVRL